jgi:hypothetical protein
MAQGERPPVDEWERFRRANQSTASPLLAPSSSAAPPADEWEQFRRSDNRQRRSAGVFDPEGPIAFFTRGMTRTATLGLGADLLAEGGRRAGISIPQREPEGLGEKTAHGAGMALGMVPALYAGAGTLTARGGAAALGLGRYLPAVGRAIRAPFQTHPFTSTVIEVASGAGAGAGEELAGPEYGPLGALAGGLATGITTSLTGILSPALNARKIFNTALRGFSRGKESFKETILPFTEAGAEAGVRRQLQQRAIDPAATAERVGAPDEYGLSPSQRTGEDNFLALERAIAARSPAAHARLQEQIRRSETALRRGLEELGETGGLEGKITAARARADAQIQRLGAGISEEESSRIYARELMASLDSSNAIEAQLWDIPNVRLTTSNLTSRFKQMWVGVGDEPPEVALANRGDMPAEAVTLLSRSEVPGDALIIGPGGETVVTASAGPTRAFAESESVLEIHGLASKMREIARKASAAGDSRRAWIANQLGDAAWLDLMGSADLPSSVAPRLQAAREYTRASKKVFRQGDVGRILGRARAGGARVEPTEMLEVALPVRGNARAAVTSDELNAAIGFGDRDPAVGAQAIEAYLRQRFLTSSSSPDGTTSADGARAFMRNNAPLLNRHPQLRQELEQSVQDMVQGNTLGRLRRTVSAAMGSQTPLDDIRRASAGNRPAFRSAVMEFALHPSNTVDEAGIRVISGKRLLGFLNQPKTKRVFAELFSEAELGRLETLATKLFDVQRAGGPLTPTIPGEARPLPRLQAAIQRSVTFFAGVFGAKRGAELGQGVTGASLKTAGSGSSLMSDAATTYLNKWVDRLLVDTMSDEALYKALLTNMDSVDPRESRAAAQVIRDWIRRTRLEIPRVLNRTLVPSAIGTGAEMSDREPRLMPSHPVPFSDSMQTTPDASRTMADIVP